MTEFWGQAGHDLCGGIKEQAKETLMGPIEKELRSKADIIPSDWKVFERMSNGAKEVCWDAARQLKVGFGYFSTRPRVAEVMSEAIEAAEKLGI